MGSIRRALVSIVALALILPLAAIMLIAFESLKQNATESAISENRQIIRQIAKHFAYYFDSIDSIGLDVYRNDALYSALTMPNGSLAMKAAEKDQFFSNLITKNEDALCVRYQSDIDGYQCTYAHQATVGDNYILRIGAKDYFKDFYALDDEALSFETPSVLLPRATAEGNFLVYCRRIYHVLKKQPVGKLYVILRTNFLKDACNFYATHEQDALALYSLGGGDCLYQNAQASPALIAACAPFFGQVDEAGIFRALEVEGVRMLTFLSKVPGIDAVALKAVPDAVVQAAVVDAAKGALWLFALVGALAIALAIWFASGIARPLAQLREAMVRVERGEYGRQIQMDNLPDEIVAAVGAFNRMTCEIDRLINESLLARIRLQEAELSELQAKINPHFISNTLQSISGMAVKHNAYDVKYALEIFSGLMRYGIGGDACGAALEAELQHARQYLALNKLRLGDRLAFELTAAPEALAATVPRLTLQPLVENSIHHGLDGSGRALHVAVRAALAGETLTVEVCDDGAGFAAPQAVLDAIAADDVAEAGAGRRRIGLSNVYARLRHMFGGRFHMEIESEPHARTCVRVVVEGEGESR